MAGREPEIFAAHDRKLEVARQQRQSKRRAVMAASSPAEEKSNWTDQAPPERVGPFRETEAGFAEEQPAEGYRDEATKQKTFPFYGEAENLPEKLLETFASERPYALKNLALGAGIPRPSVA
jgi:hypothetical protein